MLFTHQTEYEKKREKAIRDVQPLLKRISQGWRGIEKMTDGELRELLRLARDSFVSAGDIDAPDVVREAYLATDRVVRNELNRRRDARTNEFLRRRDMASAAHAALSSLANAKEALSYALDPQGTDNLLGPLPPDTRITGSAARGMDDAELAKAIGDNREVVQSFVPHAKDADAIEAAAKTALLLADVLRERGTQLDAIRVVADANLQTLNAERDRRRREEEERRAQAERIREDPVDALNDLAAQIEELRRGR